MSAGYGLDFGLGIVGGGGPAAPAIWTPASLTPNIWLAKGVGLTGSAPVTAWANQGSNGGSFADATGPDDVAAGLEFSGTDHLNGSAKSLTNFLHEASCSVAVVATLGSGSASTQTFLDTNFLSTTAKGFGLISDQSNQRFIFRVGNGSANVFAATTASGSTPRSARHLVEFYVDYTGGAVTAFVDGASVAFAAYSYTGAPAAGDSGYAATLGARNATYASGLGGTVEDIVAVNRLLTNDERTALRAHYGF